MTNPDVPRERVEFTDQTWVTEPDGYTTRTAVLARLYPDRNNDAGYFDAWLAYVRQDTRDGQQVTTYVGLDSGTFNVKQGRQDQYTRIPMRWGVHVEVEADGLVDTTDAEIALISLYHNAKIESEKRRRAAP